MKNKYTVSIGIPAHNEELNIKPLLVTLINQKEINFKLENIIVISDGSTDNTLVQAKSVDNKKIIVEKNKIRLGKNLTQNYIFKKSKSDILIVMDADVLPKDDFFIKHIIDVFLKNKSVSLVCTQPQPIKSKSLFENIISHSQFLKLSMADKLSSIKPVYVANGRAMAYSKEFYKYLLFPKDTLADDAYAALTCIKNSRQIIYQDKAIVLYKSPSTINDHIKQSTRFYAGQNQLYKMFGQKFVKTQYSIPTTMLIIAAIKGFVLNPIRTMAYAVILIYAKLLVIGKFVKNTYLWESSSSSKKIQR